MSTLKEINQVGLLKFKPMLKVSEMKINKTYIIVNLENISGKFSDQTKVEMESI